ncbi:MAG: hypothetical protein ACM3QZ_01985 [Solirubrobacterales bacterium]
MELMTFGEFLNQLLGRKEISVSRLTQLTGMKSRNSIQRLLKDESGISLIEDFRDKLIELEEMAWSVPELEQLNQAVEVSRVGKDLYQARKTMLQIFDHKHRSSSQSPVGMNPQTQKSISLTRLFETYKSFTKLRILIFDLVPGPFTNELIKLIRSSPPAFISISQILYLNKSRSHNAATFVSAFELFNYEHYDVFTLSDDSTEADQINNSLNSIFIDKETAEGDHFTDVIKTDGGDRFTYVSDIPGNSLFLFNLFHFNRLKREGHNIRKTNEKQDPVSTIISICEQVIPLERITGRYIIKNSFSARMIPPGFFADLMAEANYFGMDPSHPVIRKLTDLFWERFHLCYQTDRPNVCFFTKRGLLDFVTNRVMTDHYYATRPFERAEVEQILTLALNHLETNGLFKIYLLKNDYAVGNIEFSYFENKVLWIFDSFSGYGEDYYEAVIDSPPIIELFDDFIKNELLPCQTYPESETIEYLRYLLTLVQAE